MPNKLKNLRITKIDVVDEGANQDAHIRFAKAKEGQSEAKGNETSPENEAEKRKAENAAKEQDNDGGNKPPIQKGAPLNMKFDTEKMTPEERAVYEDFAKRYGSEETPANQTPPTTQEPSAASGEGDDIYKGLHPAVRAELEEARKFREQVEEREMMEIAKKYELLGKKPTELAPVLKSLKTAGGTAYADMISLLDSNLAVVEKSGAFDEIGKRGRDVGGNAWAKIEAAAQEIQKSKPDMRWADVINEACMKYPELVVEYEKSRA